MSAKMMVVFGVLSMVLGLGVGEHVYANGAAPPFSNKTVIYRLDEMNAELADFRKDLHTMKEDLKAVQTQLRDEPIRSSQKQKEAVAILQHDLDSLRSHSQMQLWFGLGGLIVVLAILGFMGIKMKNLSPR